MKLSALFLSLFIGLSCFAKSTIEDPQNILEQVDTFLEHIPFEQAFQEGQESRYFNECLVTGCEVTHEYSQYSVLKVNSQFAEVKAVTDETSSFMVRKSDYNASNGNILRLLFSSSDYLNLFSPVDGLDDEMTTIVFKQVIFTRGTFLGQNAEQAVVNVMIHQRDSGGTYEMEYPLVYTLTKGVPFVAQASKVAIPGIIESRVIEFK